MLFPDGAPDVVASLMAVAEELPLHLRAAEQTCSAVRTSAGIERKFRSLKLVIGDLRTGLSSEQVDLILFLKHNREYYPLTVEEIFAVYESLDDE